MSSRPATGRRADTLFDSRFRIEQSYPRGRSGETLHALDTLNADRPVIVKRPALQDAPPLRTSQEQNLLHEKRVLEKLAGHPAIPTLVHSGTFRVGAQGHHYFVLAFAGGESLEALVKAVSARRERLHELELLVIMDGVLDALQMAHEHKVAHGSIEPRNIFWDRQQYMIALIGWGNAAMLDSEAAPAGVGVTHDLIRLGRSIAFAASGGHEPEEFNGEGYSHGFHKLIGDLVSADPEQRRLNAVALRKQAADLRRPLETERDSRLEQVRSALATAESMQLESLRVRLQRTLDSDPGYPAGHALLLEIDRRLGEIAVQENLHAIQVYLTSGNTSRALTVLEELRSRYSGTSQPVLEYLMELARQMQELPIMPVAAGVPEALEALLHGDAHLAATLLTTSSEPRQAARQQQNRFAELLTRYLPEVVLLRPHLARLEELLVNTAGSTDALARLRAVNAWLLKPSATGLQPLRQHYLDTLKVLQTIATQLQDPQNLDADRDSPAACATRAMEAAQQIVQHLEAAGQMVFSDRQRALDTVQQAKTIDPSNTAFDNLDRFFKNFHVALESMHENAPASDSDDVVAYLLDSQEKLKPYVAELPDPGLQAMSQGIDTALAAWQRVGEIVALGGRKPAIDACQQAADAIRPLSSTMAAWFENQRKRLEQSGRIEALSASAEFGKALEIGWQMWDGGRASDALRAGEVALGLASTDAQQSAARRLMTLSESLQNWIVNDGPMSQQRTEQAQAAVNGMFTPEEEVIRRTFSKQMPDATIYLKAMLRGIVEPMRESSAAAPRTLFFDYALRGMVALYQENADEADFWRDAALKTLETARTHPAFQALDVAITRRQLILEAVAALNSVQHVTALPAARQAVHAPLASAQLEAADQAMRLIDEALAQWSEGDFRTARQSLEKAAERATFAEATMNRDLTPFKTWLQDLTASVGVVQQAKYAIEQIALVPPDDPPQEIIEAQRKMIEITRRDLGEAYTETLRNWRDTYLAIRDLYLDEKLTKPEKVRLFESYTEDTNLEANPTLPIMRHWGALIYRLPDPLPVYTPPSAAVAALYAPPVAPPSVDAEEEEEIEEPEDYDDEESLADEAEGSEQVIPAQPNPVLSTPTWSGSPAMLVVGIAVLVVLVVGIGLLLFGRNEPPSVPVTLSAQPSGAPQNVVPTDQPTATPIPPTNAPLPSDTPVPSPTPPTLPPTITRVVPTPTKPTTNTPTPNATPLPAGTVPTLPVGPQPNQSPAPQTGAGPLPTFLPTASAGTVDVLKALEGLPTSKATWNKDWFGPAGDGWQLGTSTVKAGTPPLLVRLGPEIMTPLFGVDAARKISRVDATFELSSYERSILPSGQVAFGLGIESLTGPRAAAQVVLVQSNVMDIGMNLNGQFRRRTQVAVVDVKVNMTAQRNPDNTISVFIDGQLIGTSNPASSFAIGTPINIYLYTATGGVVVKVTSLKAKLE